MLDINNNKSPKLEVSLNGNFPFYINIWNVDYIFVASDSVPKSLEIAKDNIIERCNKNDCEEKVKLWKLWIKIMN